jgi:2-polyprenyl-3-methyl-5-hydroxy-6-metoxy-1,4-benzoquinol methylase
VGGCCDPRGCDGVFDERFARRRARRYRRKGLDATAQRMVELLTADGVDDATVLEVGGGVGEIGLELLRHGAASVTTLELSPGYDEQAAALQAESGLTGRVTRRLVDIAADPDAVEPADVVVLHRVVCCYPDVRRLLAAVAGHARQRVVFSFPRRNAIVRGALAVQNRLLRAGGREFQAFAHPPAEMFAVLAEHGMRPAMAHPGTVWQVAEAVR